jgi:hypothetical protein
LPHTALPPDDEDEFEDDEAGEPPEDADDEVEEEPPEPTDPSPWAQARGPSSTVSVARTRR